MKIVIPNGSHSNRSPRSGNQHRGMRSKPLFLFLLISLLSFVIGVYIPGKAQLKDRLNGWVEKQGHNALRNDVRLRHAILKLPKRVLGSFAPLNKDFPKIYIDIKAKHIQKLHAKRAKALSKGILVQGADDFVPAVIRYDDRSIEVKLRLKGDWTDHLEGKKWSFRIHVKGKDQLFGMRRFSIQHPKVRGFSGEPLFMETLRHVGVLAPRYFFIDVVINGDSVGIMAVEEHFSKELLELNGRREGVIVRYDESLLWDARLQMGIEFADRIFHSYKNTAIDAFQSSRVAKSPNLNAALAIAVGLLRSFTSGDLMPSEVFDIDLMGRYLAVVELLGSRHAMWWHNQRFYLNPITLKLEPIGFDADLHGREKPGKIISQLEPLSAAILDDSKIFDVYHQTLLKLSEAVLDRSLVHKLQKDQDFHMKALRKEFYLLEAFPLDELKERALFFQSIDVEALKQPVVAFPSYPKLLHAFLITGKEGPYLEISTTVPQDITISSIKWVGKKDRNSTRDFQLTSSVALPLTLPGTPPGELPRTHKISYKSNEDLNQFSLEIFACIKGDDTYHKHVATYYFPPLKDHPIPRSSTAEQISLHAFLTVDNAAKKVFTQQGRWQVRGSLVIPTNYDLVISKGTTLIFSEGEGIFASGALLFEGTQENPIVISGVPSKDGKAPGTWQGIMVLNSQRPSEWSYVTVSGTKSAWNLTGGVMFYKSKVHLRNCVFENSQGEDALNIVESEFHISNTDFFSTISDAFDADFSSGEVHGGIFRDIGSAGGGDAIDISGSNVSVSGTVFEGVDDKALSVGEGSTMSAKDIRVNSAGTAAASKDGSLLEITNSRIDQVSHAVLMAYIKKPEFGTARITATNIKYSGSAPFARVETGSVITVDGKEIEQEDLNVKNLYKTIMKPGFRQ